LQWGKTENYWLSLGQAIRNCWLLALNLPKPINDDDVGVAAAAADDDYDWQFRAQLWAAHHHHIRMCEEWLGPNSIRAQLRVTLLGTKQAGN